MTASQIRTARKAKGWTQRELAEILGVTTQTVSYWEQGRVSPHALRAGQVLQVLGLKR